MLNQVVKLVEYFCLEMYEICNALNVNLLWVEKSYNPEQIC